MSHPEPGNDYTNFHPKYAGEINIDNALDDIKIEYEREIECKKREIVDVVQADGFKSKPNGLNLFVQWLLDEATNEQVEKQYQEWVIHREERS